MLVNVRIFRSPKIATKKERFNSFQKRRIGRHHVGKLAMLRASLPHDHLAVLFQNLRFDFTRMLMHQSFQRSFAADHGDRKSVVWGKSVDLGGRRIIKKKREIQQTANGYDTCTTTWYSAAQEQA